MNYYKYSFFLWFVFTSITVTSQYKQVSAIELTGNKVTKPHIIFRELEFHVGDTVNSNEVTSKIRDTEANLRNTSLFNFITIRVDSSGVNEIKFKIHLVERWYIWPFPQIENADRNFSNWLRDMNFSRLSYGLKLDWYNFRGLNQTLNFVFKGGFERELSIGYGIPYIDKKRTTGLKFTGSYFLNKELNFASSKNVRDFLKSNIALKEKYSFGVSLSKRNKLYITHLGSLFWNKVEVADTIQMLQSNYLSSEKAKVSFFTLGYTFRWSKRDYIHYPLSGTLFQLHLLKQGLGAFDNSMNVLTSKLLASYHLPLSNRWNWSQGGSFLWNILDAPPYDLQRGLGYVDYVRGYEFYVLDAENYVLVKSQMKYNLLKKREKEFSFIPVKKFNKLHYALYLNAFVDGGYAEDNLYSEQNKLSNKIIIGYGLGLDFVSYYDIVLRLEYSFNIESENGFFVQFKKAF